MSRKRFLKKKVAQSMAGVLAISAMYTAVPLSAQVNDQFGSKSQEPAISSNILKEELNRAPVAVKVEGGVYIGWRLLKEDTDSTSFDILRNGIKINEEPITTTTNYLDADGTITDEYTIVPYNTIKDTQEPIQVWNQNYLELKLDQPEPGVTKAGETYTYEPNDISVGDLDGDGEYELVVKWYPSNSKDNSQKGYTGPTILDAYKLNGEKLWRIDLGFNIRSGAHYTQFMVYDFDGDGKAEVACKTADGTVDGVGNVIGDKDAFYANSDGYILEGPEYLTIFNGETGGALDTIEYNPPRGNVSSWGDSYGNRVDRFLACVAYLDGETPSLVMCRGYYTRSVLVAYNLVDGKLQELWKFDTNDEANREYAGQGNHGISVADVDGDGKDEIIYGSCTIDHDGTGLYNTKLGHGDAMHVGDLDPTREGLEVFKVQEEKNAEYHVSVRDALNGEMLWGYYAGKDIGRGLSADIDPRYRGEEVWASSSDQSGIYSIKGDLICKERPSINFAIWWDGDLLRETLDHNWDGTKGVPVVDKWDYENSKKVNLLTAEGTLSCNGTKGTPCLQADLFGDWREEFIARLEDGSGIRIYTTTDYTDYRMTTLMQDHLYRLGVAWQNVGYNQPPHTSFYIGDTTTPVDVKIVDAINDSLTLTWSSVEEAEGYNVYKLGGNGEYIKIGEIQENYFKDSGLEYSKEYFYKVTSIVGGKESYQSLEIGGTPLAEIKSVKPLERVEVAIGKTPKLPEIVSVIYTDGTEKDLQVEWDTTSLDTNVVGIYQLSGRLLDYTNQSIEITLTVEVKEKTIQSVSGLDEMTVEVGDHIELPQTVTVKWSNDTTTTENVTWESFDGVEPGVYTIRGKIDAYNYPVEITVKIIIKPLYKFDFGGKSSKYGDGPVEPGYIEVGYDQFYNESVGYGIEWIENKDLFCVNRQKNNKTDDMMKVDYIAAQKTYGEFKVDLDNGKYQVEIWSGDLIGSTGTELIIEDSTEDLINAKEEVKYNSYVIDVVDGTLNIRFGSKDKLTGINGVVITRLDETEPGDPEQSVPQISMNVSEEIEAGEVFDVVIGVTNSDTPIYSQDLTIVYDKSQISFIEEEVEAIEPTLLAGINETEEGVRVLVATEGGKVSQEGAIRLTFRANESITEETSIKIATTQVQFGVIHTENGTSEVLTSDDVEKSITIKPSEDTKPIDKETLSALIREAEELINEAVVGPEVGNYPEEAKEAFALAIDGAKQVLETSETQQEVDSAVSALRDAIETFKDAQIKEGESTKVKEDINADGKVDAADLALAAYYYRATAESSNWANASVADLNGDEEVSILDLALIATKILEK